MQVEKPNNKFNRLKQHQVRAIIFANSQERNIFSRAISCSNMREILST